jgi:uncharacterized YccA/Bax inhibitor family protein
MEAVIACLGIFLGFFLGYKIGYWRCKKKFLSLLSNIVATAIRKKKEKEV